MAAHRRQAAAALRLFVYCSATAAADDIRALTALYNSLGGPKWISSSNWFVGTPCNNSWHGLRCDAGGTHVVSVDLVGNGANGTLPTEIGLLSDVTNLHFGGRYTNAQTGLCIDCINGTLPTELFQLSKLQNLTLGLQALSGTISPQIGKLQQLTNFGLGNYLSGTIPVQLTTIPTLEYIYRRRRSSI
jgi:hypothetical protein